MNKNINKLLLIFLLIFPICTLGVTKRSYIARSNFIKTNPCPNNLNIYKNKCPGYIVDHIVPLCAGGLDSPINMQWQTIKEAKDKDKLEWKKCAAIRRSRK